MLLNAWELNTVVLNGEPDDSGGGSSVGGDGIHRVVSGDVLARLLDSTAFQVSLRIIIEDADFIRRDYSDRGDGINWVFGAEWGNDINANIGTATVRLWREIGLKSLAPYRANASYNKNGPCIDGGRYIRIETAETDLGVDAIDSDYRVQFEGYIDSVDWEQNPIVLECRDLGAELADTWFSGPGTAGTGSDEPIQQELQELLDLCFTFHEHKLYVPVAPDPAVMVGPFRFDIEPYMDALVRLSQVNGWDLRYRYIDAIRGFGLMYRDPKRNKTVPDFTIWPSQYIDIRALKINRLDIRNDVYIWYGAAGSRQLVRVVDADSQQRYGIRTIVLQEASDSPIKTMEAATFMAKLIAFDLGRPLAEQHVEMFYFWPVDIHDLLCFKPNGVHSDVDMNLAVQSYRHILNLDVQGNMQARTQITTRGRPGGSYWQWLARRPGTIDGTTPAPPDNVPPPSTDNFTDIAQTPDFYANTVTFTWTWNGTVAVSFEVFVFDSVTGIWRSAGSTGTTEFYVFNPGTDIEPFIHELDVAIEIDFYVVAHVTGFDDVSSATCSASYANASP